MIQCSKTVNIPLMEDIRLMDTNTIKITLNKLKLAYKTSLPLKAAKFKDVMDLARKYVGHNEIHFYEALKSDNTEVDEPEITEDEWDQSVSLNFS